MPNWWLPWAERIARVLAEVWLQSRPAGGGGPAPPHPPGADPAPDAPPPAGAPGGAPRDPA
jgi:hypothetical protein